MITCAVNPKDALHRLVIGCTDGDLDQGEAALLEPIFSFSISQTEESQIAKHYNMQLPEILL